MFFSLGCSPSGNLLELKPVGLHLQWKKNISPKSTLLILLSAFFCLDWVFCFVLVVGFLFGSGFFFTQEKVNDKVKLPHHFSQRQGPCCQAGTAGARQPEQRRGAVCPADPRVPAVHICCPAGRARPAKPAFSPCPSLSRPVRVREQHVAGRAPTGTPTQTQPVPPGTEKRRGSFLSASRQQSKVCEFSLLPSFEQSS